MSPIQAPKRALRCTVTALACSCAAFWTAGLSAQTSDSAASPSVVLVASRVPAGVPVRISSHGLRRQGPFINADADSVRFGYLREKPIVTSFAEIDTIWIWDHSRSFTSKMTKMGAFLGLAAGVGVGAYMGEVVSAGPTILPVLGGGAGLVLGGAVGYVASHLRDHWKLARP
ncbi:MAG: hypothetical protein ABI120_16070 [Gemmatimonadaceae bacterium]